MSAMPGRYRQMRLGRLSGMARDARPNYTGAPGHALTTRPSQERTGRTGAVHARRSASTDERETDGLATAAGTDVPRDGIRLHKATRDSVRRPAVATVRLNRRCATFSTRYAYQLSPRAGLDASLADRSVSRCAPTRAVGRSDVARIHSSGDRRCRESAGRG